MDNRQIQQILAHKGLYSGAIDGILGAASMRAIATLLYQRRSKLPNDYELWSNARKGVAAVQLILVELSLYAGSIDGLAGYETQYAIEQFNSVKSGTKPEIWRASDNSTDRETIFGPAGGPRCTAGTARSPFPLKLSWDLSNTITSFRCHELVADKFSRIYENIADTYTKQQIADIGLDIWGGCYNYRNMRGGSTLSTHAYGIAVDTDPVRNQLRWGRDRARLAKSDAEAFWRIVEAEGAVSLGRTKNYDFMHYNF